MVHTHHIHSHQIMSRLTHGHTLHTQVARLLFRVRTLGFFRQREVDEVWWSQNVIKALHKSSANALLHRSSGSASSSSAQSPGSKCIVFSVCFYSLLRCGEFCLLHHSRDAHDLSRLQHAKLAAIILRMITVCRCCAGKYSHMQTTSLRP